MCVRSALARGFVLLGRGAARVCVYLCGPTGIERNRKVEVDVRPQHTITRSHSTHTHQYKRSASKFVVYQPNQECTVCKDIAVARTQGRQQQCCGGSLDVFRLTRSCGVCGPCPQVSILGSHLLHPLLVVTFPHPARLVSLAPGRLPLPPCLSRPILTLAVQNAPEEVFDDRAGGLGCFARLGGS